MPAPAVYVLAIVGTVGAVIAFKEFVYDPHIAPAIGRWKFEYTARRRRQAAMVPEEQQEVPMQEQRGSMAGRHRTTGKYSDDEDSGNDGPASSSGNHPSMRGGLLLRRSVHDAQSWSQTLSKDDEMDALVAREVDTWRNEITSSTAQDLRHRHNVSGHALDESIQTIPYVPLSPSRAHVLFDSASASPATLSNPSRLPSERGTPAARPTGVELSGEVARPPTPASPWHGSNRGSPASVLQRIVPEGKVESNTSTSPFSSPPPQRQLTSSPPVVQQSHRPAYPQHVPSLSQSYPQDLDYEHGLELLSPPSSRSGSPFSMADISPNPASLGRLSSSSRSSSAFSSNVSSPSPLRTGLTTESPRREIQVSPFLDPPLPQHTLSASITSSVRSSAYHSFGSDDDDDDDVPLGLRHSMRSPTQAQRNDQTLLFSSTPVGVTPSAHASTTTFVAPVQSLFRPVSTSPNIMHTPAQSDSELSDLDFLSEYAPSEGEGEVVEIPRTGSVRSMDSMSDASGHGAPDNAHLSGNRHSYETDSDASWSVAGGSDAGADSPTMEPSGSGLTRGGTLKATNANANRFGWKK